MILIISVHCRCYNHGTESFSTLFLVFLSAGYDGRRRAQTAHGKGADRGGGHHRRGRDDCQTHKPVNRAKRPARIIQSINGVSSLCGDVLLLENTRRIMSERHLHAKLCFGTRQGLAACAGGLWWMSVSRQD